MHYKSTTFRRSHCNAIIIKANVIFTFGSQLVSWKSGKDRNKINYVNQMLISNILIGIQSNSKSVK